MTVLGQTCKIYATKMEQKTAKLYPSAPLLSLDHDLKQILEKI